MHVTDSQLIDMIGAQEILNIKYNGPDWRKKVSLGFAKMALIEELAEMGAEYSSTWKWWSNKTKLDQNNATFEFIDVIHFSLLILLKRYSEDQLVDAIAQYPESHQADMFGGPVGDPHNNFIKAVTRFLRSVDVDNKNMAIIGVRNIIETGALLLAINEGDVFKAYQLKNARNHERVDGGVMEGKYDKSQESELSL